MRNAKGKKHAYFGSGAKVKAVNGEYYGITSPDELYSALKSVWCKKTCAPRLQKDWSQKNVTLGQCSVTAFLAQDIFGGKVLGVTLSDGGVHCFNQVNGVLFDLTSEQFGGKKLDYGVFEEQSRVVHFEKEEKYLRYSYLKKRLRSLTERNAVFADNALIDADIAETLKKLADKDYRDFLSALVPEIKKENVLGVRWPDLKRLAKIFSGSAAAERFKTDLPHRYLEENTAHAFLINEEKDLNKCVDALGSFLPYVDNWATCDSIKPKVFEKNKKTIAPYLYSWMSSGKPFVVRYAIGGFMNYALGDDLDERAMDMIANMRSCEYYVNMMRAWYFATALSKNYSDAVRYLENRVLDRWTHEKTIRKAIESFRVGEDRKSYIKTLK